MSTWHVGRPEDIAACNFEVVGKARSLMASWGRGRGEMRCDEFARKNRKTMHLLDKLYCHRPLKMFATGGAAGGLTSKYAGSLKSLSWPIFMVSLPHSMCTSWTCGTHIRLAQSSSSVCSAARQRNWPARCQRSLDVAQPWWFRDMKTTVKNVERTDYIDKK